MYAKNMMITDVISIFPDASISLAFQIMKEKNVSQLPVIKDSKLVGLISEETLKEFTPSKATTLSIYELNYVLNKTKIEDIMEKDLITVDENELIENVATIMVEKDCNMIPVVTDDNTVQGLICRADIITSFLEMLGAKDKGARISLVVNNEVGTLSTIIDKIKDYNLNIIHISVFNNIEIGHGELIIRVDSYEVDPLVKELKDMGFNIIRVDKN